MDENDKKTDTIVAGKSTVYAPIEEFKKFQKCKIIGRVSKDNFNAQDNKGNDIYTFEGDGWNPEGYENDYILEDSENSKNKWCCKPELFEWTPVSGEDNLYEKDGKTFFGYKIEEGIFIKTLDGSYTTKGGDILTCIDETIADFYCIQSNVKTELVN